MLISIFYKKCYIYSISLLFLHISNVDIFFVFIFFLIIFIQLFCYNSQTSIKPSILSHFFPSDINSSKHLSDFLLISQISTAQSIYQIFYWFLRYQQLKAGLFAGLKHLFYYLVSILDLVLHHHELLLVSCWRTSCQYLSCCVPIPPPLLLICAFINICLIHAVYIAF